MRSLPYMVWGALIAILFFSCRDAATRNTGREKPDSSRFTAVVLAEGLNEPLSMEVLPNHNVLFIERKGAIRMYDATAKAVKTIARLDVFSGIEDGLLGVALDPAFTKNNWVYFYYAVAGEKAMNRLSRMELKGDKLLEGSERILLEIPTQRKYCCHSGGSLAFGPGNLLYLSTGDNTNAEEAEGYIPIDERPGRSLSDDQGTAANTNDLRGKILRIRPEPDGSYSIPNGNLFPRDGSEGRPEIYVMGCRNPYKIFVDQKTGFLYWGDVGPYTLVPAAHEEGNLNYDEINQARQPGFFGWPYFLGDNEAFPHYDFATKKEGPKFDPLHPVNLSPNNTGRTELPPAQPAMIWYGRLPSKRFPLLGKGGASAMVGPVYHSHQYTQSAYRLPDYYDGKLFIFDWVRRWIFAVTLDTSGNYMGMEPFLEHLKLAAPMDMAIGPDGAIYILEYGTNWFAKNADARLVRVEYSEGNRNPVARIEADRLYGAAPLRVNLSAAGSVDYDKGDHLRYSWQIDGKKMDGLHAVSTLDHPGVYDAVLTVYDDKGGKSSSSVKISVGNTPPAVEIQTLANRSFYWDNAVFDYHIAISDAEDRNIDSSAAKVSFTYIRQGKDLAAGFADNAGNPAFAKGLRLLEGSDCKTCHSPEAVSVGPSYRAIAARYDKKKGAVEQLARKVLSGGNGNWGTRQMLPHPELTQSDAKEIVQYILSLKEQTLPLKGKVKLSEHLGKGRNGSYLLTASYTDQGAHGIPPLPARQHVLLRDPRVEIEDFDKGNVRIGTITTAFISYARAKHAGFAKFDKLDLTHIGGIRYRIQANGPGGRIELHLDSISGRTVSTLDIPAGEVKDIKTNWKDVSAPVQETKGVHDLYFVFVNPEQEGKSLFNIDWIYFMNEQ